MTTYPKISRGFVIKRVAALTGLVGLLGSFLVAGGLGNASAQIASAQSPSAQSVPAIHRVSIGGDVDTQLSLAPSTFAGRATTATTTTPDCGPASATPVPDGEPIVVSLPPAPLFTVGQIKAAVWRHPMVADLSWRLHFEAFMYLPALAVRAVRDGSTGSLDTIIRQVVAFHVQNPDPGTSAYGWDEGTAQRRLQVEDCLYELTRDARLVPGMVADARVQLGSRYYGLPYHPVHNHGLMANLRLLRTGTLLKRAAWVTTAVGRMQREAPLAFSPAGTAWEQSSSYQLVDASLWGEAADELAALSTYPSIVTAIRAVTTKAKRVIGWVTEPDGNLVQIGDSDRTPGDPARTRAGVFRDSAAGYTIGRWSPTDPRTTYYTIRYGPPRRAHGHDDRGSVTWSTLGARVLVGPGRFGYNSTAMAVWRLAPIAQDMAIPATGAYTDRAAAAITRSTIQAQAHAFRLVDGLYGRTHVRDIDVLNSTHRLVVRDSYAGNVAFRQYWHLDPVWRLVKAPANGTALVFKATTGQVLRITTTGRLAGLSRAATRPVAGWNFPTQGVRVPAYQIAIRSVGAAVVTTFTISSR